MAEDLKELCEDQVASRIQEWDAEIDHLDDVADMLVAHIEDNYYRLIGSLRSKEKELKEQLARVRAGDEDSALSITAREQLVRNTEVMQASILCAATKIISDKRRQLDEEANISTP